MKPSGFITVTDWRGGKVIDIPFLQKNVLPGSVRKVEALWKGKWWEMGKFTATLSGSYGENNNVFNPAVVTFWLVPWKALSVFSFGLFLIILFFVVTRKRWKAALKILFKGE